ncbi:MAG: hypothetical protein ABIK54_00665 [candidate division WOR-3 bacterium]
MFGWYASRVEFQHLCWSPDSRRLAFTARYYDEGSDVEGLESGDVVVWVRVDSQLPVQILTPSVINRVIPDHSGEQLALVSGWGVFTLNFGDGSVRQLLLVDEPGDRRNYIEDGVWSGSGTRLALTVFDYSSNRFQLRELETVRGMLRSPGAEVTAADWLAVLYYEGDSALVIAERPRADSAAPVSFWRLVPDRNRKEPLTAEQIRSGAFPLISYRVPAEGEIELESLGVPVRRLKLQPGGEIESVKFAPDCRHIAYTHFDGSRRTLWLVKTDGSGNRRLPGAGPYAWQADGSGLLIFHKDSIVHFGLDGRVKYLFSLKGFEVSAIVPAPEGNRLLLELIQADTSLVAVAEPDSAHFRIIGKGYQPRWLNAYRACFRTATGFGRYDLTSSELQMVNLITSGFAPEWLDDTTVIFVAGTGVYQSAGTRLEVRYPEQRQWWCVNVRTGRMWPYPDTFRGGSAPAVRKGAVISPDHRLKAWIGDAGPRNGLNRPAVYVSDVKGGGRRIVAGPWTNY